MNSLILEGFMGCGKSYIAKKLSAQLQLPLIDTDQEIEKEAGKKIARIFEEDGEEAFRRMETALLRKMVEEGIPGNRAVISLGGGMPCREENREYLKKLGRVVYIKSDPELLIRRLKKDSSERPMLAGAELEKRVYQLLADREEQYLAAADAVITLDESNEDMIADQIRRELGI